MPYNDKSLKRDINNLAAPQIFNKMLDDYEVITGRQGCMHVSTMQNATRYDFPGSSLNANEFDIVQTGSGHTITVTSSELRIATGTTASTETIIRSKKTFTIPFRLFGIHYLSQRIANQEFYIEIVSTDGSDVAYWLLDGTSATTAKYNCKNSSGSQTDGSTSSATSTGSYSIYEIELYPDECYFFNRGVDSTSARGASLVRTRFLPDPNKEYYVQIRVKNLGTAPASSTTWYIDALAVQDISEITAEITSGRGSIVGSQSIPVGVTNTISINSPAVYFTSSVATDTTTTLAASGSFSGTAKDFGSSKGYFGLKVVVGHAGSTPNVGYLEIQQSPDNSTYRLTHRITIPNDGLFRQFEFPIIMRYAKIIFVNGSVAQTSFAIYSEMTREHTITNIVPYNLQILQTTTALGASATFTGPTIDVGPTTNASEFRATVFADQGGTLYLEQSRDNSTWRTTATQAVTANTTYNISTPITYRYVRCRYVNGATAQGTFELNSSIIYI